jgi:hypothetical protein
MEMENWLHHLDADTPSISPFQLKWDQQQLVLSHSGLKCAAEVSNGGAHVQESVGGPAPVQPRCGPGRSRDCQVHEKDSAEKAKGRRE